MPFQLIGGCSYYNYILVNIWQAINSGVWERPLEVLPDPLIHPSFKEMREKILSAVGKVYACVPRKEVSAMSRMMNELWSSHMSFPFLLMVMLMLMVVPWQISIQWSDCEMMNGFVQELFNSSRDKLVSERASICCREPCTAIYSFVSCFMLKIKIALN